MLLVLALAGTVSSSPKPELDYECSNAESWIPSSSLSTPYYSSANSDLLKSCGSPSTCASGRCVVTGQASLDGESMQACCMWDIHQYLYPTPDLPQPGIPSLFVTEAQADRLMSDLPPGLKMEERWYPSYNWSGLLIWSWGCLVAIVASYKAGDQLKLALLHRKSAPSVALGRASFSSPAPHAEQQETLDLQPSHAAGFLLMSSATLLILFFFDLYVFVAVLYALGCAQSFAAVAVCPCLRVWEGRSGSDWGGVQLPIFGYTSKTDVAGNTVGLVVATAWFAVSLYPGAQDKPYYWIMQVRGRGFLLGYVSRAPIAAPPFLYVESCYLIPVLKSGPLRPDALRPLPFHYPTPVPQGRMLPISRCFFV